MFVEDLIIHLSNYTIKLHKFDQSIVSSFYNQLFSGTGFTEKQRTLAISLIMKYEKQLNLFLGKNISNFMKNPVFKLPIRKIHQAKTIGVLENNSIKVSFPYDEKLIEKFKHVKPKLNYVSWNPEEKSWIFSLDERSILFLSDLVKNYGFETDEKFKVLLEQTNAILENFENFVPLLRKHENSYVLSNVHQSIQDFCHENLMTALFEARKLGIFTWDDNVEKDIALTQEHIIVKDFLKNQQNEKFTLNLEKYPLSSIKTIVKNLFPCLIVIPGGSELEKIKINFELFKELDISSENVSVMFRLSNDTNKEFNEFVRNNKLNNPITDNTLIVCLSNNIPKPIIESRISFNCVLNYNFYSPHFKLRDFINTHHNIINIIEQSEQRRLNFGDL